MMSDPTNVEALVKRLREDVKAHEITGNGGMRRVQIVRDAADALAALSADLSMAQAAAETARNACDHWEARAKELEEDLEMSGHAQTVLANTSSMIRAAESRATALAAENERLKEALTPSAGTKAAYIGEFSEHFEMRNPDFDEDDEGDAEPEFMTRHIPVSWTTIKEIMRAIRARAALEGKDG